MKPEIRNPKSATRVKGRHSRGALGLRFSFGFRALDFIRHSSFVIRHLPLVIRHWSLLVAALLTLGSPAQAQVSNLWTINFGQTPQPAAARSEERRVGKDQSSR